MIGGQPATVEAGGSGDIRANIEDILPLQVNQLALLFHRDLRDEDPGFLQVRYRLEGPVDVQRYQRAWQTVIAAHPALRTSIRGRDDGDPLAIVWRRVDLRMDVEDWRAAPDPDRRMRDFLADDRSLSLDLGVAPAMRLRLLRTDDETYEVVWTCHHVLVDGWSASIVLKDVITAYRRDDGSMGADAPPSGGLRAYARWVGDGQDPEIRGFWTDALAGYAGAPPLRLGAAGAPDSGSGQLTVDIDEGLSRRVAVVASALGVTPAVLVQAAWALVLSIITHSDDVAFGMTVSGRNADIDGMERMVGFFSNAVPMRVRIDAAADLPTWLADFRNRQFDVAHHEHASLADIHRWSDVPGHRPMFQSFVVVENFPAGDEAADDVVQRNFRSGLTTVYPITLAVGLVAPWFLHLRFDRAMCSDEAAAALADQLVAVLEAVADDPRRTVGEVRDASRGPVADLAARGSERQHVRAPGRAARTDVERRLVDIWSRYLDLPDVDIDADYFDLGGTSLGAVRLFGAIREEFGVDLPLSTLIMHPTIAGVAQTITGVGEGSSIEWTCLVPIQPEGSRTPIAAVHGGGGDVLFYRNLAIELGDDQPLYGLQPVGLDGVTEPLDTVPAMAERYIEELLEVQPTGPYRLIGFCFGGTVCLEMAAQLEEMGHEVDYLGIIDGGLPVDAARYERPSQRIRYLLANRGATGLARAVWRRLAWRADQWRQRRASLREGVERGDFVPVAAACTRAFVAFEPRASSAPITLIRSTEVQAGEGTDWDYTWEDHAPAVDVAFVDADHLTLFEGVGVEALADIIRESLPRSDP